MTYEIKKLLDNYDINISSVKSIKNKFYLTIDGDMNDGDYIETSSIINESDIKVHLNVIKEILKGRLTAIGEQESRSKYKMTDEESEYCYDILPHSEYGCHSLGISNFEYYDENGQRFKLK